MAELLGLGMTHFPPLAGLDERMAGILKGTLRDPDIPEHIKNPANWPPAMQKELGNDEGKTAASAHRASLLQGMRKIRSALDEFRPDFMLIWGDDQHENFVEDIIPAFCVLAYDNIEAHPWKLKAPGMPGSANVWREGLDYVHRAYLLQGMRKIRSALDEFRPDVMLIWGDDQHENFVEDIIQQSSRAD